MAEKSYITMTGISKWAVVNSLWAAIRQRNYVPDRICLVVTEGRERDAEVICRWIHILLASRGKSVDPVQHRIIESNIPAIGKKIAELIDCEKTLGNEVALDITPGRKAIVSSALIAARQKNVDHIFYLYIEDLRNSENPYPMKPFRFQHFYDLEKEVWT